MAPFQRKLFKKSFSAPKLHESTAQLLINISRAPWLYFSRRNLLDSSWMYEGRDSIDVSSRVDPWRRKLGKEAEWELRPDTEGGQGTGVHHGAL